MNARVARLTPLVKGTGARVVLCALMVGAPLVLALTVGWPPPPSASGGVAHLGDQHRPPSMRRTQLALPLIESTPPIRGNSRTAWYP